MSHSFPKGGWSTLALMAFLAAGAMPAHAADVVDNEFFSLDFAASAAYYSFPNVAIVDDYCPTLQTDTIDVSLSETIVEVEVGIQITHTWRGDLYLLLESPNATETVLYLDNALDGCCGASSNNLYGYFDEDSATDPNTLPDMSPANFGTPFYTIDWDTDHIFQAMSLDEYIGEDTNGTWTIKWCDAWPTDTGVFKAWALYFNNPTTTSTSTSTTTTSSSTTTTPTSTTSTTTPASTTTSTAPGTTTTTVPSTSSTTTTTQDGDDDVDDDIGDDDVTDDDASGDDDTGPGFDDDDGDDDDAGGDDDDDNDDDDGGCCGC
ncbi:MAG: proprotein convertase P-domain-containing protein [Deltaproteobacteria bacterium]|nr:proprotein convertase P-domain-containing protein [Deltaproteobacteria bacterium]